MAQKRYVLPALLLLALIVRVWGIGFGLPDIIARPDETEIAGPAVGFLSGDLRPPFFQWPTLFVYAVAAMYVLFFAVTKPFGGYATLVAFAESRRQSVAPFLYMSRSLSMVMGVMTVWWVYLICRRLFDETVAAVAALFLALCFLHVRDSHFGTTDIPMTALVVLTVLLILRWRDTGKVSHAAVAGLVGGLAASTKYNGMLAAVAFVAAVVQRVVEERSSSHFAFAIRRTAPAAAVFVAMGAVGFFGASPYILIDWPRFLADVRGVESHVLQGHGLDVGQGWSYYLRSVLPAALGWPIFIASLVAIAVLLTTRMRQSAVLLAFPIAYYLIAGRGYTVFARYILPVVPFLCIIAAWFVVSHVRAFTRHTTPIAQRSLVATAAIAFVAPTAYQTLQLDLLLGTTDNRVIVARQLRELATPNNSVYQSGEHYGYVPMWMEGRDLARVSRMNESTGQFDSGDPDWIVIQRSPLVVYSTVPAVLEQVVEERYQLVRHFPTADDRPNRLYDQQDAFFLPLNSLGGIARPGPAFDLYRKRPAAKDVVRDSH